jgi:hypothetical protein
MSGMHLLPVYYTTTNHKSKRKKPRKISRAQEEAQRKHDKFLKKMGIPLNYVAPEPAPLNLGERVNQLPQKKIQDMDWSPCPKW